MMNRKQLREVQHLPAAKFYDVIAAVVKDEVEREKSFTFYNLAASMFTALRRRYNLNGDMLHSIAIDTIDISNGLETPSELAAILKEETGFDIYQPPHDDDSLTYIEVESNVD
jgi:hypothetical protein